MESSLIVNGTYPTSLNDSSVSSLKNATDVSFMLHGDGASYCMTVTSNDANTGSVHVDSASSGTILDGVCPEELGANVSTAAGTGTLGFSNGTGTAAAVASPAALSADTFGNMYFTDGATSRIRKLTTAGVVSTLAGNGSSAYAEGTGTSATFNWPQALTILPDGRLLITDSNNHKIRALSPSTTTSSLFAGGSKGTGGSVGSSATAVQFDTPRGIVYNAANNSVYVSDSQNNRIIKLDTSGTVLAIYGQTTGAFADGNGTSARFNYPEGLAVDTNGNVYVADTQNQRIRKIDTSGNVTTIAGNGTAGFADGVGTDAKFNNPNSLTIASDGKLYVCDTANHRIRVLSI